MTLEITCCFHNKQHKQCFEDFKVSCYWDIDDNKSISDHHMRHMHNSTCSVGKSVLMYSTALKSALSKASWLGKTYKKKKNKTKNPQRKVNAGNRTANCYRTPW